ncbi:MAG: ferrochelatase [Cryobacterium sp.]|nr:ferrochelatase [Oligoflexia bacterium]
MKNSSKKGILLLNLGTPDAPDAESVRRYLGEFLMDPYVIDLPWLARAALVKGIILRTRPKKSAEAYKKVWTDRGSPLSFHTHDLVEKVQKVLGDDYRVLPVMRYGNPSVEKAIRTFQSEGIIEVTALPLYPQFSLAASKSSEDWVMNEAKRLKFAGKIHLVGAFYQDDHFLDAFVEQAKSAMIEFTPDFTLFSFHGLPERHVKKVERVKGTCLASDDCCARMNEANVDCYRAQCFHTAREIASRLGLSEAEYSVAFQSRLGTTPWIKPYSDVVLKEIATSGKHKKVLMISPSFVADCLETLEEIAIRGKEDFIAAGGDALVLAPSLNSSDRWVTCVSRLVSGVS